MTGMNSADPALERWTQAGPWQLMAWRFQKHRLAVWSLWILLGLYFVCIFAGFFAPYTAEHIDPDALQSPPQIVRIFQNGKLQRPFVYPLVGTRDPVTLKVVYHEDRSRRTPIRFFVRDDADRLCLFGSGSDQALYILGTDDRGRDMLSLVLYGGRVSLFIGFVGVVLSFTMGIVLGGISGYYGGWIDNVIQRLIDLLRAIPTLPLWLAMSAAVPRTWSSLQVFFAMTVLLSFLSWTGLARVVRGKILSLRSEDYALAAMLAGASERRIIFRHLLPGFTSHIIVSLTLTVPGMILGETALSFLGIGLREPMVSWGVLLEACNNVNVVATAPWIMTPVFFVIVTVLTFNFIGDGLRDAADPYAN